MFEIFNKPLLAALRADQRQQSKRHARDCVLLAVVTTEAISAELIDKAIAHHRQFPDEDA